MIDRETQYKPLPKGDDGLFVYAIVASNSDDRIHGIEFMRARDIRSVREYAKKEYPVSRTKVCRAAPWHERYAKNLQMVQARRWS